jgi:hypothetical protein
MLLKPRPYANWSYAAGAACGTVAGIWWGPRVTYPGKQAETDAADSRAGRSDLTAINEAGES